MSDDNGDAEADETAQVLNEVREALLDTASGEVIGALWDELREARAAIDLLVARPAGAPGAGGRSDGTLAAVAADVAALRKELSVGLVVEPSESLAGTVDQLGVDLDAVRAGVTSIEGEVRTLRSGIEDIIGRLDEGLILADELAPPAAASPPALADQFAALQDQVTTEFEDLRQLVDRIADRADAVTPPESPPEVEVDIDLSPITGLLDQIRTDLAELPSRIELDVPDTVPTETTPGFATIDPDTVDVLREEIRSAAGVSEEVIEAIRNDLVALRRRIKLRAEGESFTEAQLDLIADAVARRLAE